jgi:AraC family transcriptional regulator
MDGSGGGSRRGTLRSAQPIRVEFERLPVNAQLAEGACDERFFTSVRMLRVIAGSGRGCMMQGSVSLPMILVPLRGSVRVADGESVHVVKNGQLSVSEPGQCLQAIGNDDSCFWIAIVASTPAWRQLFDATTETLNSEPLLLPAVHAASRELRRAVVRVARDVRRANGRSLDMTPALLRFATLLGNLQARFDGLIERCPGRSLGQRRSVFVRLQRAYQGMQINTARGLNVTEFARIANYSPCHFVRTFIAVFGETPHTVMTEQRLQRARRLVHETTLSITEVARASGFEDRCAFARSFKQRFGATASATRRYARAMAAA